MKAASKLLLGILGAAVIAGGIFGFFRMEGAPPTLDPGELPAALGAPREMRLVAADPDSGLRRVRVTLTGGGTEKVLAEETFPAKNFLSGGATRREVLTLSLDPKALQLPDGEATLRITARDYSWRNWWNGNAAEIQRTFSIDTRPPRVSVLTEQHNINQGGAGLVIYEVSETGTETGVRVGEDFYPGHPADAVLGESETPRYMALFALSFRQAKGTTMAVEATDAAGNTGRAGFYHYIRPKEFPTDDLRISDRFLQQKLPEFQDDLAALDAPPPADPVAQFLTINRTLRKRNTDTLLAAVRTSDDRKHWSGRFLRLQNSARRANFADHRRYFYGDEIIDRQVHMGIDLASVARAPVEAANAGRVAFAGDLGIYGGTIIIDHGFGLFSSYSHLSQILVAVDQMVDKGETIGNTGATGLAGGDHLHFGMMVHTTFVTPVEWWDPNWIQNNILGKIEAVSARP